MAKMFIHYDFSTCTEIFKTAEEAVANAINENPDGECVYLNHYVDNYDKLDGWEAYTGDDGDLYAVNMCKTEDWTELLYWEDAWNIPEDITVEEA